ncbi:right-handed parallel beta-helix repeat-containing protein [Geobacter grbiciae]|uniref:right-handed parallel beta-helix repeat-containing protein n=1 Tax=Geobacter grbiciae TaxID=155042 RepID=UPI001C03417D|nr:NosD domain-containing protein [Geobacter grbiciae]MBT1075390.1 right-handed parallel beta-helix repeat-containing protein [Geobacter grbiciae]
MKKTLCSIALLSHCFVTMPAVASAACTAIDKVPFTVQKKGDYCLSRDVSLHDGVVGILVEADHVVIDLGGHRLQGNGGEGSYGIRSDKGVTVRNGTVSGFHVGVAGGAGSVVENLRVEQSTRTGILVNGAGSVVRNNIVTDACAAFEAYGIVAMGGKNRILDNKVTEMKGASGGRGFGIRVYAAGGNVIEGNHIGNASFVPNTFGIIVSGAGSRENALTANSITNVENGIVYDRGGSGTHRGNRTTGVPNRYIGGTDGGGNE